jgi:hypothetical protein
MLSPIIIWLGYWPIGQGAEDIPKSWVGVVARLKLAKDVGAFVIHNSISIQ